jgi:hypothetical protein
LYKIAALQEEEVKSVGEETAVFRRRLTALVAFVGGLRKTVKNSVQDGGCPSRVRTVQVTNTFLD